VRNIATTVEQDRYMADDIEAVAGLLDNRGLVAAVTGAGLTLL
jgi:histidine ammonia-lyase